MANKTLDVYYKKKSVGTLAETDDKRVAFQYSDSWLNEGFAISPFSLPLKSDVFIPPRDTQNCFKGLFGVFADSLPDSWGELLLDRVLSSMNIDSGEINTIDRLAYVGTTGMGSLEYFPSKVVEYELNGIDYDKIAKECNNLLESKSSDKLDVIYNLGGSSGGTRPKILIKENGEDYIIKFPSSRDGKISGRREYDYYLCAKKTGINMMDSQIIPSQICDGYFKTKRFDRNSGEKVFSITFAGLLEADFRAPTSDYETYMKLINVLTRENKEQIEQMYKIMCFNVFSHNLDDHTKNFSFLYDKNKWRLAPAYDLTYSDTYYGEHTTSVSGKGKHISDSDLINVGIKAGVSLARCKELLNEVKGNIPMISNFLERKIYEENDKIKIKDRLSEITKDSGDIRRNDYSR